MYFPKRLAIGLLFIGSFAVVTAAADETAQTKEPWKASKTEKYRLIWTESPATQATLGWHQKKGSPGTVHFGPEDHGQNADAYPQSQTVSSVNTFDGFTNCFVVLKDLSPDTRYYLVIRDEYGTSRRFQLLTAPVEARPFTFIAGGDSRNFRDVRIAANRIVAKLRPLFVAFTGDMINKDTAEEWDEWLDDWQHTTTEDGQLIPIVAHRGNHEKRPGTIPAYFNTPPNAYFGFSIGGNLFRYLALNSEIPAGAEQGDWVEAQLKEFSTSTTHLAAGYHKPMRPHVSKKSEGTNPEQWAAHFYKYGLDLAIESDSHVMKRTAPLKPSPKGHEGFAAAPDDPRATVYIGEGCWGAPLRANDDNKPWTLASGSFNGFDWIEVSPAEMKIKTVEIRNPSKVKPVSPDQPYENPEGLSLWEPESGTVLTIQAD